jgi:hypothetical protein
MNERNAKYLNIYRQYSDVIKFRNIKKMFWKRIFDWINKVTMPKVKIDITTDQPELHGRNNHFGADRYQY